MSEELRLDLSTLAKHFSDEGEAYKLVERIRWPNGPVCPHCHNDERVYFLQPKNGARKTRTGKVSHRRLWKGGACRKQFSVLVGSIFEDSKIPLSKWLLALYLMSASKNGVAAYEVHRTLGVTNKTAWFMLHRVREAMKRGALVETLRGTVVADETFIGGKPRNQHRQGRPMRLLEGGRGVSGAATKKVPVLALVNRETGEVRSRVLPSVTGATLHKAMAAENLDMASTRLLTDSSPAYRSFAYEFAAHEFVDHSHYEYVRGDVTTNPAENFFSQLKRSVDGTHHHVSPEHLPRYLAEFDFRYSTRTMSDTARMKKLVSQSGGRRLTYKPSLVAG